VYIYTRIHIRQHVNHTIKSAGAAGRANAAAAARRASAAAAAARISTATIATAACLDYSCTRQVVCV